MQGSGVAPCLAASPGEALGICRPGNGLGSGCHARGAACSGPSRRPCTTACRWPLAHPERKTHRLRGRSREISAVRAPDARGPPPANGPCAGPNARRPPRHAAMTLRQRSLSNPSTDMRWAQAPYRHMRSDASHRTISSRPPAARSRLQASAAMHRHFWQTHTNIWTPFIAFEYAVLRCSCYDEVGLDSARKRLDRAEIA